MEDWNSSKTIALWLSIVLIIFIFLSISIIYIIRIYLMRIHSEREKANELKLIYQENLIRDSIMIQELERERIAADLHDSLIGKMNSIKYLFYSDDSWTIQDIQSKIEDSIKLTRHISHDLCPPLIEETSLTDIIEELTYSSPDKLSINFTYSGHEYPDICKESKLQLSRISQEILNNIFKHSKANHVSIHIHFGSSYFGLYFSDNGVGYDIKKVSKGLGQKNIRLRSEYLKAIAVPKSKIGRGSSYLILTEKPNI